MLFFKQSLCLFLFCGKFLICLLFSVGLEVMKVLRAKKHAKMRRQQQQQQRPESVEKPQMASEKKSLDCEAENRPADTEKDKEKDHQVYIHISLTRPLIILSFFFISFFDQFHIYVISITTILLELV